MVTFTMNTQSQEVLLQTLDQIGVDAREKIRHAERFDDLEVLRIQYLGSHGELARISKELPKLSAEYKSGVGKQLNSVKKLLEELLNERKTVISEKEKKKNTWFDVTVPGKKPLYGALHPITKIIDEVTDIFHYLGFSVVQGPEVEWDEINFQKLRLDKNHPSRDTQETYYFNDEMLLRVHTSSVQIRYMQTHKPPIRIVSPGRAYRRDQIDATHLPAFYQIEGLLVDEDAKLTDLLGVLSFFVKRFFGKERKVRFYGHNFPYTEPSLEVEVQDENGKWLEILGCGMVHPEVLSNCGIDPTVFRGWAFGMGGERLAMLKYGITDIRLFYSGDLRFLNP